MRRTRACSLSNVLYTWLAIRTFRSRALRDFFLENSPRGIRPDLVERVRGRLQALHCAESLDGLRVPGWRFDALHSSPVRYAIAVNGTRRLTFERMEGDAVRIDLEQYH
ncbi:MAG: type II toxin-antitoxin system RelE/ParE family toxin [Stellaceae bacterium]